MSTEKVFVLDPYHDSALEELRNALPEPSIVLPNSADRRNWAAEATGILVRSESRISVDTLIAAKKLRVIVKQGVGVDNIDLEAAKSCGIRVYNTPGINGDAVAELALALAFSVARRVVELHQLLRNGTSVKRSDFLGRSLTGRKLGVIGMGAIGHALGRKWTAVMEGDVITFDPYAPRNAWDDVRHSRVEELMTLLKNADVITLHVPLTPQTKGLIGRDQFAIMKQDAILLNCARGAVVDEEALIDAVESGRLWGAGLDATEIEPPRGRRYERMFASGRIVITPHVGASTREAQELAGRESARKLLAALKGQDVSGRLT